jgi:hypothetical protein
VAHQASPAVGGAGKVPEQSGTYLGEGDTVRFEDLYRRS